MPVEIINLKKDLPKATRNRRSVLQETDEWKYVQTKLAAGLKPQEGLRVVLSHKSMNKIKNAPRMFKKLVDKYIQDLKLDYDVFQRGTTDEGTPILYIAGRSDRLT